MIYQIRINKRLRNIKVYVILKKLGRTEGFMTKLFMRIFGQERKTQEQQSAIERLK